MLALACGLIFIIAACYLAYIPRPTNIAVIFWLFSWGMMLILYKLLGWDYNYDRYVVLYSAACVTIWALANLGGEWLYTREFINAEHLEKTRLSVNPQYVFLFVGACAGLGMIAPFAFIASSGIDVGRLTNISGLFEVAESTHILMAENRLEQDPINKVTLLCAMAGVITVGIYSGIGSPGKKLPLWMKIAPLIPFFMMMMLTTVRTLMIAPMIFLLGAWIAGLTAVQKEKSIFRGPLLKRLSLGVLLGLFIIIAMQSIRASVTSLEDLLETLDHLRLWFAGYQAAFTTWLTTVYDGSMAGGSTTFRVLAGFLGGDDSKIAYGSGMVWISTNVNGNAKTALATFIQDFGVIGTVIFCVFFGALTGVISAMIRNRHLVLAPILALLIGAVVWAPNSWFLGYGTRLLAPVLPIIYIAFFWKIRVSHGRRQQQREGTAA